MSASSEVTQPLRQALCELRALLETHPGEVVTASVLERAECCAEAAHSLRARELDSVRHAELVLLDLKGARRATTELGREVVCAREEAAALCDSAEDSTRAAEGLRQMRKQDVELHQATARMHALSAAMSSAKTEMKMAHGAAVSRCPLHAEMNGPRVPPMNRGISLARQLYMELLATQHVLHEPPRSQLSPASRDGRAEVHQLSEADMATATAEGSLAGTEMEAGAVAVEDVERGHLLDDLKHSLEDTVAENLALSCTGSRVEDGFRCSFTARHCGASARIQLEDCSSDSIARVSISCDVLLADACIYARELVAAGHGAEQMVRLAFWPALAARAKQSQLCP